jgi:sulfoacetaldehyde acetyltransferase
MKDGVTTLIEAVMNQKLRDLFRRDVMKKPVVVAGINKDDMRPQPGA